MNSSMQIVICREKNGIFFKRLLDILSRAVPEHFGTLKAFVDSLKSLSFKSRTWDTNIYLINFSDYSQ